MAKAKKTYRKFIRLKSGKRLSKVFKTKEAAENWYSQMHTKKQFQSEGLVAPLSDKVTLKKYVESEWLERRKKNYPASTYASDLQRVTDYVLPALGNFQISKITSIEVRALLVDLVEDVGLSPATRDRVRALISAIFNDAMNRKGALVSNNPTFGLKFSSKRKGKKLPSHIKSHQDVVVFLRMAKSIDLRTFVICLLGVDAGFRKQEKIAVRWKCVNNNNDTIEISEKFEQASGKIVRGTKQGEFSTRTIPLNPLLKEALIELRAQTKFNKDEDFILCREDGSHMNPRTIWSIVKKVGKLAGLNVTDHGLRHSFGREFIEVTGNMKALQEMLGHASMSTTEIYAELGVARMKPFRGAVKYDLGEDS